MSLENRRFIRFLLDIPAVRRRQAEAPTHTVIKQVSIGGCLIAWDDAVFPGDEFRLEVALPNKNRLPLDCRVIYKFDNQGVGVRFQDITRFEQELLAEIISQKLENEGLPLLVDPFTLPPGSVTRQPLEGRAAEESRIENVIAGLR